MCEKKEKKTFEKLLNASAASELLCTGIMWF